MRGWSDFEMRWLRLLLNATVPDLPERPGLPSLDLAGFWPLLSHAAPPLLRLGLRATTWTFTWLPLLLPGFYKPFYALNDDQRDAFLSRMGATSVFLLRQLAATLKIIASFALFRDPDARRSLGVIP